MQSMFSLKIAYFSVSGDHYEPNPQFLGYTLSSIGVESLVGIYDSR